MHTNIAPARNPLERLQRAILSRDPSLGFDRSHDRACEFGLLVRALTGHALAKSRIEPQSLKDVAERLPALIPAPTQPDRGEFPRFKDNDLRNATAAIVEQQVRWLCPSLPDDEVARMVERAMAAIAMYLDPASASNDSGDVPQIPTPTTRNASRGASAGAGGAKVTLDLRGHAGRNRCERLIAMLRAQPGGDALDFDELHERAAMLLASADVQVVG